MRCDTDKGMYAQGAVHVLSIIITACYGRVYYRTVATHLSNCGFVSYQSEVADSVNQVTAAIHHWYAPIQLAPIC